MDASEVDQVIAETAQAWCSLPANRLVRCDVRDDLTIWLGLAAEAQALDEEERADLRDRAARLSDRWCIAEQFASMEREEQQRLVTSRLRRSDLPRGLSIVIRRRLARAGYWMKRQLREADEAEIANVHGIGPKAIEQLRPIVGWTGEAS